MDGDIRAGVYGDLHGRQMIDQEAETRYTAKRIFTILRKYLDPKSVLDVGCGLGSWLYVAREMGIIDIKGLEGPWLEKSKAVIDGSYIEVRDLERAFSLGRTFDLAICLEVGEHLSAAAAGGFVGSLGNHSHAILFSAAVPFQGGHHHVNEQFLPYWIELFASHGFLPLDIFRGEIWADTSVLWWLRQNLILFAHADLIDATPALAAEARINRPLSIVHPDVYMDRLQQAQKTLEEHRQLIALLSQAGTFETRLLSDNRIHIRRL